jgi:hypothetical protein
VVISSTCRSRLKFRRLRFETNCRHWHKTLNKIRHNNDKHIPKRRHITHTTRRMQWPADGITDCPEIHITHATVVCELPDNQHNQHHTYDPATYLCLRLCQNRQIQRRNRCLLSEGGGGGDEVRIFLKALRKTEAVRSLFE